MNLRFLKVLHNQSRENFFNALPCSSITPYHLSIYQLCSFWVSSDHKYLCHLPSINSPSISFPAASSRPNSALLSYTGRVKTVCLHAPNQDRHCFKLHNFLESSVSFSILNPIGLLGFKNCSLKMLK